MDVLPSFFYITTTGPTGSVAPLLPIFVFMTMKEDVRAIQIRNPESRDDDKVLTYEYRKCYTNMSWMAFSLSCVQPTLIAKRRAIQNEEPELRGNRWIERQKHSNRIKMEYGHREMPERTATEIVEVVLPEPKKEASAMRRFLSIFS